MTEPPIESQPDGVQPRAPRIRHRWLDLGIAGIAILISLFSLAVGFYNAQSQQRMVAATSWPFLTYGTTQVGSRLTLQIGNQGVGPARLKSLIVRYRGREVHGLVELLQVCCGLLAGAGWTPLKKIGGVAWESRPTGLYRAGESTPLLVLDRTPVNYGVWEKLSRARLPANLSFRACYCSVLGDCWISNLDPVSDPRPVDKCPVVSGYRE